MSDDPSPDQSDPQYGPQPDPQYDPQSDPRSDPQPGPQPDPQPGPQPDPQPGPQRPRTRAAASFFDSVRRTGLVRTDQRWIGGVAGGLAQRLNVDPVLVRCIWAVLCVFSGVGLLLYGIAWALLPEEGDGRIHLQQALHGEAESGLAGAAAAVVAGFALQHRGVLPVWWHATDDWAGGLPLVFWTLMQVGLTVGIIWLVIVLLRGRRQDPRPGAFTPGPRTTPMPATSWTAPPRPNPYGANPRGAAPRGPSRQWVGPVVPRVPGPGRRLSLLALALVLIGLALAGLGLLRAHLTVITAPFAALGAVTAALGAGVTIAALLGRRGGWISGLGVPVMLIAVPALILGSAIPPQVLANVTLHPLHPGTVRLTWTDLESMPRTAEGVIDLGLYGAASISLDLSGAPADPGAQRIRLNLGAGHVSVSTASSVPLVVDTSLGAGTLTHQVADDWTFEGDWSATLHTAPWAHVYTPDGRAIDTQVHQAYSATGKRFISRSDAARNGGNALTLELAIGTGEVEVTENAPGPSWTGIGSEDVWIVSSWNRSDGTSSTTLPVEGMNHAAVSEEAARICLKAADDDQDDWDNDWDDDARGYTGQRILSEELADLDPGERASYESCVNRAIARGDGVAGPDGTGYGGEVLTTAPGPTAAPTSTPTSN